MPYEHYVREKILKPLGIDVKKASFRLSDFKDREELVKHYAFNASYLKEWNQGLPQLNITKVFQLKQLIRKLLEFFLVESFA
jgi:hypothetical protein